MNVSPPKALELLTTGEVAELLRIPRKQVYRLIHEEGLPAVRLSRGRYRIARGDLDAWLDERREAPTKTAKRV